MRGIRRGMVKGIKLTKRQKEKVRQSVLAYWAALKADPKRYAAWALKNRRAQRKAARARA